jgi:hypothetical protein
VQLSIVLLAVAIAIYILLSSQSIMSDFNAIGSVYSSGKYQKLQTRVVMFVPSKQDSAGRRSNIWRQFMREKWKSSDAVLLFILGTKAGSKLELDLPHSAKELPGTVSVDEKLFHFCVSSRAARTRSPLPKFTSSTPWACSER